MKICLYCAEEIQDNAIVCKHCGSDIQSSEAGNINAIKEYADYFIKNGWTIGSMTGQHFVMTKREDIGCMYALFGIVGCLFFVIPGLLILLIGYAARGTKTRVVTYAEAQAWVTQSRQQALKLRAEQDARKAANDKKIADLKGNPLQLWYKIPSEGQLLLIVGVVITIIILIASVVPILRHVMILLS